MRLFAIVILVAIALFATQAQAWPWSPSPKPLPTPCGPVVACAPAIVTPLPTIPAPAACTPAGCEGSKESAKLRPVRNVLAKIVSVLHLRAHRGCCK